MSLPDLNQVSVILSDTSTHSKKSYNGLINGLYVRKSTADLVALDNVNESFVAYKQGILTQEKARERIANTLDRVEWREELRTVFKGSNNERPHPTCCTIM